MARPSTPILSTRKIAEAAMAIIDAEGDFTIGQLAHALKVRPSSLYNHVTGRAEIIELIRDHLDADSVSIDPLATWDAALASIITQYRERLGTHPRLIPLLTAQTISAPGVASFYQSIAGILREAGFEDEWLLDAVTTIDGFALGAALDLAAPADVWDATKFSDGPMHDALASAPSGRERADRSFEFGLRVLIDGLSASPGREMPAHQNS